MGQAVYRLVPLPRRSATRPGVWTKSCRLRDLGSTRRVWLSQRGLVAGPHERYEQRVYNHPPAHPLSPHPIPPSRPSSRFVFCLSRLQIRRVYAQESFPLWVESLALDFTELGRYLAERKWRKKTEKHHTLLAPPHTLPSPHLSSPPLQTSPPSLHPHPPLAPSTYCHHCNRCHHRPQPSSPQPCPPTARARRTWRRRRSSRRYSGDLNCETKEGGEETPSHRQAKYKNKMGNIKT